MDFGRFGFGFLRLPHVDPNDITDVDLDAAKKMVDLFLERGFRYFDTAYTYLNYKSEAFLRQALVERYPRDRFAIATKLPCDLLKRGRTAQEIFDDQLQKCGVEYFDVYLLHGLDADGARTAENTARLNFLIRSKLRVRPNSWASPFTTPPRCWMKFSHATRRWMWCRSNSTTWTGTMRSSSLASAMRSAESIVSLSL